MKTHLVLLGMFLLFVAASLTAQEDIALKAFELRMNGYSDSAKAILAEAVTQYPDSARIWFEYGRCIDWTKTDDCDKFIHLYSRMNPRLKAAKKCMYRAAKLEPDNARYHYWAGQTQGVMALASMYTPWRWPLVRFTLKHSTKQQRIAVALSPDNPQFRYDLVNFEHFGWLLGGNKKNALLHTDTLMQQSPVYGVKARELLATKKKPFDALSGFSAILTNDSGDVQLLKELGFAYSRKIHQDSTCLDSALQCYLRALQLDPGDETALKQLCRLSGKRTEMDPVPYINAYLDNRKDDYGYYRAIGLMHLANQFDKKDKKEDAQKLRQEAKMLNPKNNNTFLTDLEKP